MKKYLIFLFLISFQLFSVFSQNDDTLEYDDKSAELYEEVMESGLIFSISLHGNGLYHYEVNASDGGIYTGGAIVFRISEETFYSMRICMEKFREWVKLAKENNITINRDISEEGFDCSYTYIKRATGTVRYDKAGLAFFASSESPEKHNFVIKTYTNNLPRTSEYRWIKIPLSESEVDKILASISDEVIKKAKNNIKTAKDEKDAKDKKENELRDKLFK